MFDVICVTNRKLCKDDFFQRLSRIAKSDVNKIILREKDLSEEDYFNLAEKALEIGPEFNKEIILHNYLSVAKRLSQAKIHLPLSVLKNCKDIKKDFDIVGTSVHNILELKLAENLGADYVFAGHIFKTDCKRDLEPKGTEFLQSICDNSNIPVYAIGGINLDTVSKLKSINSKNFKGVCIMSEFMTCDNPINFAKEYLKI
ncbi:MAG: thiamine phosphate synthase [Ruminococcus sp.]|nr:thiamine phosphate synthase [Ruminococcus sp.]